MRLYMFDAFVAEGKPEEVATYTFLLLDLLKYKSDKDDAAQAKKEMDLMEKFGNMTFQQLRDMEMGEEGEK